MDVKFLYICFDWENQVLKLFSLFNIMLFGVVFSLYYYVHRLYQIWLRF